jgi:hypothetical protein
MKRLALAGAAILALVISYQAVAQGAVEVAPQYRERIKEYMVKKKVRPVTSIHERVKPGYRVPAKVALRTVPADWGPTVRRYRYFYQTNVVQFVDPRTRQVVMGVGF